MTIYFDSGNAKTNMTTAIAYLIFGVLMTGVVIALSVGLVTHTATSTAVAGHLLGAA